MQYWIKFLNILFEYLFCSEYLFLFFKLIWLYILYKIFLNIYFYFLKLCILDILKFLRLYSFILNLSNYCIQNYKLINFINSFKTQLGMKSYVHLFFYYIDFIFSFFYYMIFVFWKDLIWFLVYDFKMWWRKTIKWNIKFYMKEEIDAELAKYFYFHHGVHFSNRLILISCLRFIYFWFYVVYFYFACLVKILFFYLFKNYYYFIYYYFFIYKIKINNNLFLFIWKFYIILRNGWYYLYNSYFGYFFLHWYRKYDISTDFEFNWIDRLEDPHLINKKGLLYFIFDLFLPWSFYKKQTKYGNFFYKNYINFLFYSVNIFVINILSKIYLLKYFNNINFFQKYNIIKIKLLRYSLIFFNRNWFYILISYFLFCISIVVKIFINIYQFLKNTLYFFRNIFEICFVSLEYSIIGIILYIYKLIIYIYKLIIGMIKYIYFYRLLLFLLSIFIFVNFKYIVVFLVYVIDWFFEYYIMDWINLPDMLHSISTEPSIQAKFLIESVTNSILEPVAAERLCKDRLKNFTLNNTWYYVITHCFSLAERFINWQYSRLFTFQFFLNWHNVYFFKIFYYTTGYKVGLICACLEYFFIDYLFFYFLDAWDIFLFITNLDLIFFKFKFYIQFCISYFDKNFFNYFKSTSSQIKIIYNFIWFYLVEFLNILQLILFKYFTIDFKFFIWYIHFLYKLIFISIFEFYININEYIHLYWIKIQKTKQKIHSVFLNVYVPFFNWVLEFPFGNNFLKFIIIKLQEFIFKYKLSIDGLLLDIENIEQRMLHNIAIKENNYQLLPFYPNGKSFFNASAVKDFSKLAKKGMLEDLFSKYHFRNRKKNLSWTVHFKPAYIKFFDYINREPVDLYAIRNPEKGLLFYTVRGIYTNWYNLHESFPLMKRFSQLFENTKLAEKKEIIFLMDNQIALKLNNFYRWSQDIEYSVGNFNLWKNFYKGMETTTAFVPEFYDQQFPKVKKSYRYTWKFLKIIYYHEFDLFQTQYAINIRKNYYYIYPRFWFFHYQNFFNYKYVKNPEHIFDFSLGRFYKNFYNEQLNFDLIPLKYWNKFFNYRDYYVMDDLVWLALSSKKTLHNLHFLMIFFFPIFLFFIFFISGFKKLCFYNFEDYGDARFWWRRFREQNVKDIRWVTETLSNEVLSFMDNYKKDVSKKGRNFIQNQSMDFFNKQSFQVARWTLLKKYNLLDDTSYFKDFVVGKNFLLFHTSPSFENLWNIRFKSVQDSSNLDLLFAYGFSRDITIKNLVINDFVEFEVTNLDENYDEFMKISDKFINLCFILDRDFFNFKLPGWSYHKDPQNFSYIKSPDKSYIYPDTLSYGLFNFQYWFIDVFAFFISIYNFRLGLHDSRLALNEYSYLAGTLFGHTDISFYWNSYWFGLHWFHFNYFNIEQWPVNNDFKKFKLSRDHSVNSLYFGPLSLTFDYSFNQLNLLLYRFKTMTEFVWLYFVFNIVCFIYIICYINKMRTNLVTNKSIKLNKYLIDLMKQSFFSVDYLFIYVNKLLSVNFQLVDIVLKKEKIKKLIFSNFQKKN